MNCPRCDGSPLSERERDGVVVDVCPACRGIWLDRGEMEKLIVRATREFDELAARSDAPPPRDYRRDDDDEDDRRDRDHGRSDDYRRHGDDRDYPRKKPGIFEALGNIFD